MNWTKRRDTTGKVEPSEKFLEEEKFTFQRKISNVILDLDVPSAVVVNLDQTPLPYVSPGKYTFLSKWLKNVPMKGHQTKGKLQRFL